MSEKSILYIFYASTYRNFQSSNVILKSVQSSQNIILSSCLQTPFTTHFLHHFVSRPEVCSSFFHLFAPGNTFSILAQLWFSISSLKGVTSLAMFLARILKISPIALIILCFTLNILLINLAYVISNLQSRLTVIT